MNIQTDGMSVASLRRCGDHLDHRLTKDHQPHPEPTAIAFGTVVFIYVATVLCGTLPIPFYGLWASQIGFGPFLLTVIFAANTIAVAVALILFSPLSDQAGRKPNLLAALILGAIGAGLFLVADSVGVLIAARFVSGLATGLVVVSAAAALSELEPHGDQRWAGLVGAIANLGGAGLGVLSAGIFAEYAADPAHLIFWLYLVVLAVALVLSMIVPETVTRSGQPIDFRPRRPMIPAVGRLRFIQAAIVVFCVFSLFGLFSSLITSFIRETMHEHNSAVIGGIVSGVFLIAACAQAALRSLSPSRAMTAGLIALLAGIVGLQAGLWTGSLGLFAAAALVIGVAGGACFMGAIAATNAVAPPSHRAEVLATFFLSGYTGITVPSLSVGLAAEYVGGGFATLCCSLAIAALVLLALVLGRRVNRDETLQKVKR
jgi:predicted MFS family arabinose efflux permease